MAATPATDGITGDTAVVCPSSASHALRNTGPAPANHFGQQTVPPTGRLPSSAAQTPVPHGGVCVEQPAKQATAVPAARWSVLTTTADVVLSSAAGAQVPHTTAKKEHTVAAAKERRGQAPSRRTLAERLRSRPVRSRFASRSPTAPCNNTPPESPTQLNTDLQRPFEQFNRTSAAEAHTPSAQRACEHTAFQQKTASAVTTTTGTRPRRQQHSISAPKLPAAGTTGVHDNHRLSLSSTGRATPGDGR